MNFSILITALILLVQGSLTVSDILAGPVQEKDLHQLRKSVFKVRVTTQDPDFRLPWSYLPINRSHGSGFYIGQQRILTNAHVLANSRFISVQRDGDPESIPAYVEFIAHDADLALLKVDQPNAFKGLRPLSLSDSLPVLHSPVATVGFPMGGEQISVTKGIISRIEWRRYVHSSAHSHLMIQVDSAINSGNSGGPVFQGNKVVGVAFQSFSAAENTGYIIPVPVISRFLRDIKDGTYDGHIHAGFRFNTRVNSNRANILFYGLNPKHPGIKVSWVHEWSTFSGQLLAKDTLLSINDHKIGGDGKVALFGERISFLHIFDMLLPDEILHLQLIRDGKKITTQFKVKKSLPHPDQENLYVKKPRWIVHGGLIFPPLSRNLLNSFGHRWYKSSPPLYKFLFYNGEFDVEFKGIKEYIVIAGQLPHPVNRYINLSKSPVVRQVNGIEIESLEQLSTVFYNNRSKHLKIDLVGLSEPIVLPQHELEAAHNEIIQKYHLPSLSWTGPDEDGALSIKRPHH